MSGGHGGDSKNLTIDDLAKKFGGIKKKIGKKTDGFNLRELSHEDNTVDKALDYIELIHKGGKDGVKDDLSTLLNDVAYVSQFNFNEVIRQFRDFKELDTYTFKGENHQERARFARELLANMLAHAIETHAKMYDAHHEFEGLIHKLKEKDVEDQHLQDALTMIFGQMGHEQIPNAENYINMIAQYLENGGNFSLIGVEEEGSDQLKSLYKTLMSPAIKHVDGIKEKPIHYLALHGDNEKGREKVAKYITKNIAGDEYKDKFSLKDTATSNMRELVGLLQQGHANGWRNKNGLGKDIKKHMDYKDIKHTDIYK